MTSQLGMDGVFSTSRLFPFTPVQVFTAFARADMLAAWWGPDGKNYPNDSVFLEASPQRIVIRHVSAPSFTLSMTLTEAVGQTNLDWHQAFDDPRVAAGLAHIIVPANEQNRNRLHATLLAAAK